MKQAIKHGATLDALTPQEAQEMLDAARERHATSHVRATAVIKLDGNGNGQDEVFTVPMGYEFEARRVMIDLDTASDPSTGNVPLNVAGKAVEYLRSGTRIEYAVPVSPNAVPQVPGMQTWGQEQGPYLRNGEVFEVKARGLTPGSILLVYLAGLLKLGDTRAGRKRAK